MRRFPSVKKNDDYRVVYREGKSYANRLYVMYVLPNDLGHNRLGVSVSKKVGNSIIRHRIVRLMREAFRLHATDMKTGYDIVVIARTKDAAKGYSESEAAFVNLAKRHGIII
jgi:ribonuclease P protein component